MSARRITTLFVDIGGVLGTNGWDRGSRQRAAAEFGLDIHELDERHQLCFDLYELGRITLDDYLDQAIFYQTRPFERAAFRSFMLAQSQPFPEMLALLRTLRSRHGLKIVVLSNEARELAEHRIAAFDLRPLVDVFVVSAFVHLRKPDPEIYRLALDLSQSQPPEVVYLDDRAPLVEAGARSGLHAIQHTTPEATRASLSALGFPT